MQKNILLILILLTCGSFMAASAQSGFNFAMKGGPLVGNWTFASGSNTSTETNHDGSQEEGSTIAMAFSLPVYKSFWLGAEIGLYKMGKTIIQDFTILERKWAYYGYYRVNQASFMIVPEYRPISWISIHGGVGYFSDVNSNFTIGSRRLVSDLSSESLVGESLGMTNTTGWFTGIGFCPNITNELAILGEIRYQNSPASSFGDYGFGIGYRAATISLGLMYKPK